MLFWKSGESAPKINPYDLQNKSFHRRRVNSVWHGTESVSYESPKNKRIWNNAFEILFKSYVSEGCFSEG